MSFLPELVGSFSTGAAENPTLAMMDAAFAAEGLDWRYINCEVAPARLADAVSGASAMGWRGFNCSMPHKQAVIPLLDEVSDTARACQAVNCVTSGPRGWVGHNTDGVGFVAAAAPRVDLAGSQLLVLGSGGAAHAIAVEAARAGVSRIVVVSRNMSTARALADLIVAETAAEAAVVPWAPPISISPPADVSLVVNATPVGMAPGHAAAIAVDWSSLPVDVVAADVVVNPSHTTFLRNAEEAGLSVIDGRGMLVNQAAANIRLWTGIEPDKQPMRRALDAAFDPTDEREGANE